MLYVATAILLVYMGDRFSDNWRIITAILFSTVLVAGAYVLARGIESPSIAQASEEAALLQAIATKDSDADGLSDWEEALYGTSSSKIDTFNLGMTDGQAVAKGLIVPKAIADIAVATSSPTSLDANGLPPPPAEGTLTAAFAKNFFTLFLAAKQKSGEADLTESEMNDVATQALSSLSTSITSAPDFKSAKDLTVSGSGADVMKEFAVSAEAVLLKNKASASKSEILYLKDAIENNDAMAFSHIASIAKTYRDSAVGLAVLPVPKELAEADLALINAMMRISGITSDFVRADTDPLATMLALQQYPQAVLALSNAFIHVGTIYKNVGISLQAGAPGASFVNLIKNIADKQAATKTP